MNFFNVCSLHFSNDFAQWFVFYNYWKFGKYRKVCGSNLKTAIIQLPHNIEC